MFESLLTPDDVFLRVLVWLAVPTFLVQTAAFAFFVSSWFSAFGQAAGLARRGVSRFSLPNGRGHRGNFRWFLMVQAFLISWAYALLQFGVFFLTSVEGSQGGRYSVGEIFRNAIVYTPQSPPAAKWGTAIVAGAAILSIAAAVFDLSRLASSLSTAYFLLAALGGLIVILNVVMVALVLFLDDLRPYTPVYGAWLLGGLVLGALSAFLAEEVTDLTGPPGS